MNLHSSFWVHEDLRYLKTALMVLVVSVAVYGLYTPDGGHSGDSWYGYLLGVVSLALILWLTWFGVRKRSYVSPGAPLKGWLSAHVYLGLALLLLVPLHSAFQLGWNVHTLAYMLMSGVIVSGIVGVVFYSVLPVRMAEDRPGEKLDAILEKIAEIDDEWRVRAQSLPDKLAAAALVSIQETHLGGGVLRQISGSDPNCGTDRAIAQVKETALVMEEEELQGAQEILEILARKRLLVRSVRRQTRMKALMDIWLVLHIPLALATILAVLIHVFSVFYY